MVGPAHRRAPAPAAAVRVYFYDVNATSNFVANARAVLGFDPFPRFADYIVRMATGAGATR